MDPRSVEEELRRRLDQPVNPSIVSTRPGPGNRRVKFIAGETVFHEASHLATGWNSRIIEIRCARDARARRSQPDAPQRGEPEREERTALGVLPGAC